LAQYFLDTSAAVKYYHVEAGTPCISALFAEPGRKIRISTLGFIEIQSAFAMKVRSGVLDPKAAGMQRSRFLADIAARAIEVYSITEDHFTAAERLIARLGFQHRLRTLDALQLAVALDLAEQDLLDQFVTADQALAEVASLEHLKVLNPEKP
jgi:predicted nucleic acid-binding protein